MRQSRMCCASRVCSALLQGIVQGSLESILDGLKAGRPVRVFGDRTVSPTFVVDAARATLELLERRAPAGLYHCVNSGSGTWLEVAQEAARQMGDAALRWVATADGASGVAPAKHCAMANAKFRSVEWRCRRGRTDWLDTWRPLRTHTV